MSEYTTKIKITGPCAVCNEPISGASIDISGCYVGNYTIGNALKKAGFVFESVKDGDGYIEMITCKACVAKAQREKERAKEDERKRREAEKETERKLKAAAKLLAGLSEDQRRALLGEAGQ